MTRLLVLLSVLLLPACAAHHATYRSDISSLGVPPKSVLELSTDWHLQGRLLVNDGRDAWHVRVDWLQRVDDFDITLNGVLGRRLAKLYGNDSQVSMQLSGASETIEGQIDELFAQALGVQVPVSGLRYWVQGWPSPDGLVSDVVRDGQGRITHFMQGGWRVRFVGKNGPGSENRPHKVFLSKSPHTIRLVIDSFSDLETDSL